MYAELLEMHETGLQLWASSGDDHDDGLPGDLETGYVGSSG
jgi:hypothetical protein